MRQGVPVESGMKGMCIIVQLFCFEKAPGDVHFMVQKKNKLNHCKKLALARHKLRLTTFFGRASAPPRCTKEAEDQMPFTLFQCSRHLLFARSGNWNGTLHHLL
jgi:hypothetical protein